MSEHLEGHLEKPSMSAQMSATLDLCDHELDISIATDSCLICGDTMVLDQLHKHLAGHMEEVASFVLPNTSEEFQENVDSVTSKRATKLAPDGGSRSDGSTWSSLGFPRAHGSELLGAEFSMLIDEKKIDPIAKVESWEITEERSMSLTAEKEPIGPGLAQPTKELNLNLDKDAESLSEGLFDKKSKDVKSNDKSSTKALPEKHHAKRPDSKTHTSSPVDADYATKSDLDQYIQSPGSSYITGFEFNTHLNSQLTPGVTLYNHPSDNIDFLSHETKQDSDLDLRPEQMTEPVLLLPCEYFVTGTCDETFGVEIHSAQEWIYHTVGHLDYQLPQKSMCWFCDDLVFDSQNYSGNLQATFESRMWHIRDHFMQGYNQDHIQTGNLLPNHLHNPKMAARRNARQTKERREQPSPYREDIIDPYEYFRTSSSQNDENSGSVREDIDASHQYYHTSSSHDDEDSGSAGEDTNAPHQYYHASSSQNDENSESARIDTKSRRHHHHHRHRHRHREHSSPLQGR